MSQAESPERLQRSSSGVVTVEDVRELMGASTPHFALQLRNRIARLIAGLPADHPARVEGEREIARLQQLGFDGETRGEAGADADRPLPSLSTPAVGQ
ncbi:MAG TPA: hypothetical protein VFW38_07005 [Solirubrobacteraceae bacterium]|nr:hypothetical protein [Solirubrobacteraceae bacterium]